MKAGRKENVIWGRVTLPRPRRSLCASFRAFGSFTVIGFFHFSLAGVCLPICQPFACFSFLASAGEIAPIFPFFAGLPSTFSPSFLVIFPYQLLNISLTGAQRLTQEKEGLDRARGWTQVITTPSTDEKWRKETPKFPPFSEKEGF